MSPNSVILMELWYFNFNTDQILILNCQKTKTRLDGVWFGFDMKLLDSGNENEARWSVIWIPYENLVDSEIALPLHHSFSTNVCPQNTYK
jgi:hypothetical protein